MFSAEQLANIEVKDEISAVSDLKMGEHSHLKRHITQFNLTNGPSVGVISREGDESPHNSNCSGRVVDTGDCQHLRDHLNSASLFTNQMDLSSFEQQFCGWQLLGA